MKTRIYYEELFRNYPDVVTLPEFREMLGGVADITARKLMRADKVQHYVIRHTYLIPKPSVIEYILSKDYAAYKKKLKVQV